MAETLLRDTLRLAEDDIGASRPADALTRCHHILAHYPEMLDARRVLGEAYLALRKTKEAFQAFDRVLVSDPENTLAYCGRALICQQLGDYESSLDCYYQACELSLGNRQLRLEFRRLAAIANQPDFILSRVGLARLYMRGDLLAHSVREWEQVLQSDSDRVDARLGLAEALWRDNQPARAAEQCKLILQAIPSCLKALLLLGEIAYRAGKLPEANQYMEQARRLDPDGHMAHELFADALISDKALSDFILAEPARIPAMEDQSVEPEQPVFSALEALQREVQAAPPQPETADIPAEEHSVFASEPFEFSFETATTASDPPLREGESLEEMLAALIELPANPEPAAEPTPTDEQIPTDQAVDRLQTLLSSFSASGEQAMVGAASADPSSSGAGRRTPSAPLTPRSVEEATADFGKAIEWLDISNPQLDDPQTASLAEVAADADSAVPNGAAQPTIAPADFPIRRPRTDEEWAEEDDSEAGWLRWLQAQGARELGADDDLDEDGPFAALLRPNDQPATPRTVLWEAPDEEFARSLWPHDTVPQRAVRLTPGNGAAAVSDDVEALASVSSVSLRPLTLEELDRSFSASGLTRLEDTLAALRSDSSAALEQETSDGVIFTIAEDDYPARLELAERQRKTGRLDEALGHYRAVMRGAPELLDKVVAGLLAAANDAPEQAAVYRLLGDAYTRRGNYMEALEAYHRGLSASRGHEQDTAM
ncbi:MAG TPA: tetratricopeptide repeat protein [Ktedonobacterales bacterium]|nr:tetratricopeptide repeat protein [Ktedonobacterales bacterium]